MNVGVVGLWHLGETVAVLLAALGHNVIGIDIDKKVIQKLNSGVPPIEEPGLRELLAKHLKKGAVSFTDDVSALKDTEALFLTTDTPILEDDTPDVSLLFDIVKNIAPHMRSQALFVAMSQVPVGTTHRLAGALKEANPALNPDIIYLPENLQLGRAVESFLKPDRIVIGADTDRARTRADSLLKNITARRLFMSIVSAEMSKHALNAYLATSLSFIYNISDMCEAVGADVTDVSTALKSDRRIGQDAYLDSSIGFSGGTLMRDLKALMHVADTNKKEIPVISGTMVTNNERRKNIVLRIEKLLGAPFAESRIGILGVTYKPGTSTLRRSLGLEIFGILRKAGADVRVYDPQASGEAFLKETGMKLSRDPYEMAVGCNGVLLITAWPEFKDIDFSKLKESMREPYFFFDARNFLKERENNLKSAGFQYVGIGR